MRGLENLRHRWQHVVAEGEQPTAEWRLRTLERLSRVTHVATQGASAEKNSPLLEALAPALACGALASMFVVVNGVTSQFIGRLLLQVAAYRYWTVGM